MADPVATPISEPVVAPPAPAAPAVAPPPAPAVTPAVAPPSPQAVAPPAPSPAPVVSQETPEPKPVVINEVKPAEVTPGDKPAEPVVEKPAEPKSLLGDQLPKPGDPPKVEPPKPAEPPKVEPLKYETFKLPDGVQVNAEELGKYTAVLGEHQVPPEAVQQLVDLYAGEMQKRDQAMRDTWNRTREGWVNEFKNDAEIGGARQETTLQRCAAVLDQYAQAAGAERAAKLKEVFGFTGAGDNPELVRFINWAAGFTVERGRPVAANVPKAPLPTSRAQRRYANPAFSTGAT